MGCSCLSLSVIGDARLAPVTTLATATPGSQKSACGGRLRLAARRSAPSYPASRARESRWRGGLLSGLSNEDAARYAFLLATPIIGAAGVLKLPELIGPAGNGVRAQALVGALAAALSTYLAVRFLMRFFETQRLTPFGIYCIIAGVTYSLILAI